MTLSIESEEVERLAEELAHLTGESKTDAILHALEERRDRIIAAPSDKPRLAQVLDFLEREIWPAIPRDLLGHAVPKEERERILGYRGEGV